MTSFVVAMSRQRRRLSPITRVSQTRLRTRFDVVYRGSKFINPGGRSTRNLRRGMLSGSRTVGYDEPTSIAGSLVSMVSVSMGLLVVVVLVLVHPQLPVSLYPFLPLCLPLFRSQAELAAASGQRNRNNRPRGTLQILDYRPRDF